MRQVLGSATAIGLLAALGACGGGGGGGSGSSTPTPIVLSVPGAPTITTATAGNALAAIAFSAPASNGGATITGYTVTCAATGQAAKTGTAAASPISVTGLSNGTSYSCSVTATNSAGTGAASAAVSVTPAAGGATGGYSTATILCPYSINTAVTVGNGNLFTSTASWTCSGSTRSLTGNGIPNHSTGVFPGAGNPNTIAPQSVSGSMTLSPSVGTTTKTLGGPGGSSVYALNSVKFDPGMAGTCPGTMTAASDCNLANGTDVWRIEALGQTTFNFGVDANNAHVQPSGAYHYHGMPEGLLRNAGVSDTNRMMLLVGWASDGFPVYARYCYSSAMDAASALKVCTGSYVKDTVADTGRPAVSLVPFGAFASDWNYVAGVGDLDECNGRVGVTPEFPAGIYYYMATDTYPFFSRCLKGN